MMEALYKLFLKLKVSNIDSILASTMLDKAKTSPLGCWNLRPCGRQTLEQSPAKATIILRVTLESCQHSEERQ